MKRLALLFALFVAALPASAPGSGCSPLDCSPTGSSLGHGLFAVRPQGVTGPMIVDDLRTGATKWQLPAGVLTGTTLVHQDHYDLTWFDAVTGKQTRTAVVQSDTMPYLVGTSQDGRRAVLQYGAKKQTTFLIVSQGQQAVQLPSLSWAFDALAGHNLYLLRYLKKGYEVRRYDLAARRLATRPLKDPHESSLIWGSAWQRLASPDGRYLFTLYIGSDGGAMVHELDVRAATARCIDLPGSGDFNRGTSYTMQLSRDGRTLWAISPGYGRVAAIDVRNARVRAAFRFPVDSAFTDSPSASVSAVAADGTLIAAALGGELWVLAPARHAVVLHRLRTAAALAFSPDGSKLWIARGTTFHALKVV